jgi:hypothetical protein
MMERVGDRWEKMEGYCSTGQSPQWAVVSMEEEEEDDAQLDSLKNNFKICIKTDIKRLLHVSM